MLKKKSMKLKKEHLILIKKITLATIIGIFIHSCSSDSVEPMAQQDADNDGIEDNLDNCISTANPNQEDSDNDGIGDGCDAIFNFTTQICVDGKANEFSCDDYDLLLNIPLSFLNAGAANDSWGWTDQTTQKEYAIVGLNNGTAFIDVTNPNEAIYLGKLPTATENSIWRDLKVFNDYAFIVSEAANHGMQVFDLKRLRNVTDFPQIFSSDNHITSFGNAHNIVINEDTGYAYVVGANTFGGGPHFFNIQNPSSPIDEGGYSTAGYSHDAQVITYNGPDTDYTGREIYIGSQIYNDVVTILDVTDKNSVIPISTISYQQSVYPHQGWFTDNQQYFILGDEGDEGSGKKSRTLVFDFSDLDNPNLHMQYFGPTEAIDHNGYVNGNTFYLSNYRAGVRMIDISSLASSSMTEVGFFDTYPENNFPDFDGIWNVYPYFDSGNIILSDTRQGLFVIKKGD